MAKYTVQAPDGKKITLEGPEGASQDEVIRQAQALYRPPTARTPAKAPVLTAEGAKTAWDRGSESLEKQIANLPEAAKRIARDKFFADPRIARLREVSATPVSARQGADRRTQKQRSNDRVLRTLVQSNPITAPLSPMMSDDFVGATGAGIIRGAFGLPERIAAGVTGRPLEEIRADVDTDLERSLPGNFLGQVLSGVAAGGAIGKGIQGVAKGASALAPLARAITPTAQGSKLANVARFSAAGATGGAAQAAGEGSDVATGAQIGAIAGPAFVGAGKVLGFIARPIGDLLGLPSAGKILRRFTKATTEDLRIAADEFRQRTGAEPTVYEILPLEDRNAIAKNVVGSSPAASERAANLARQRLGNMGEEMADTVRANTGNDRIRILGQMADDLDAARAPAPPDAAPLPGMEIAGRSPADLKALQGREAAAYMEPVRDTVVADDLRELFPQGMQHGRLSGQIEDINSDPEVNQALINAASSLKLRLNPENAGAEIAGLTADDMTRILRQLARVQPGTPQKGAAMRAEQAIMDHMEERFPEAARQIEGMRNSYAARARMLEGMAEGGRTRTRESIPVETSQQARTLANAFGTPEGAAGRQLGQTNALTRELSGTPDDTLRTMRQLAESGQTQRAVAQNLGQDAASGITGAAEAQGHSVRALASLGKQTSQEADSLDLEDLGRMVLALNPAAMPTTRLFALSRLTQLTHMPEGKARALVDMLLSQNPATTNRAIGLLNGAGDAGRRFLKDFRNAAVSGQLSGEIGNDANAEIPGIIPEASASEVNSPGMLEPGNIDLHNRTAVENSDGSISTVRSISVGFDDGVYLIPTVVDGEVVSDEEAIAHYKETGEHLGKFADEAAADAYAQQLHEDQSAEYAPDQEQSDAPYGRSVIEDLFPEATVTSDVRGPGHPLYDPNSGHAGENTVDVRPIPGMTYDEFLQSIENAGYEIIHSYDESQKPADPRKAAAWGPHWHVEIG